MDRIIIPDGMLLDPVREHLGETRGLYFAQSSKLLP